MTRHLFDLCGAHPGLRFSPFCWRVRFALAHKGLDVDTRPWRFTDKATLAFAEHDKVPVLVDGDRTITDSFAILEYLDQHYPEAALLGDETGQARARFFKHYSEQALALPMMRIIILDLFQAIAPQDQAYFRRSREARLGQSLETFHQPERGAIELEAALGPLRARVKEAAFVDGEAPGGGDYLVAGHFMWAHCISRQPLLAPEDPLHAWFERILDAHQGLGRRALRTVDLAPSASP